MIEKSEASEACFPSLPTIPIPTSADWIMPTSFPPSPIQATLNPENFFTSSVMIAFCVGKHLEQITAGALVAASKNYFWFLSNIMLREVPSTSKTELVLFENSLILLTSSRSSLMLQISKIS